MFYNSYLARKKMLVDSHLKLIRLISKINNIRSFRSVGVISYEIFKVDIVDHVVVYNSITDEIVINSKVVNLSYLVNLQVDIVNLISREY